MLFPNLPVAFNITEGCLMVEYNILSGLGEITVDLYIIGDLIALSGPFITESPSLDPTETITGVGEASFLSGVVSLELCRPFILIHDDSSCLYR